MKNITSKSVAVKGTPNHATNSNPKSLNAEEQDKFQELENQISENMLGSFKLAAALAQIRDGKLYRAEFDTFEEYCKKRWGYSRSYCQRLADMHEVLTDLKEYEGDKKFIRNELQARVFFPLKEKDKRIKLLRKASEESDNDVITASEFAKFRKQLWPNEFSANSKPAKAKGVVIDAEVSNGMTPEPPSIIKLAESAKDVLKCLEESGDDDNTLGENLREFLKLSEPVIEWEKATSN